MFAISSALAAPPEGVHWRHYEAPVFPAQLLSTPMGDGFVTVAFTFDAEGRITDHVALTASHPAFAEAVDEAMKAWEIETRELPLLARREVVGFDFQRHRSIVSMGHRDASKAAFNAFGDQAAASVRTFREGQLSSRLEAVAKPLPKYPAQLSSKRLRGTATVNFVVDLEGQVRVPALTEATDPAFGEATLAAIKQWRFVPAKQKGLPVQVVVECTFRFAPEGEKQG